MKPLIIPAHYNYISAFLTFACTLKCEYCINKYNGLHKYKTMPAHAWSLGLNRIVTIPDRPVTLTGGEPTLYNDFYKVVNEIDNNISLDVLTNGDFDVVEFMKEISPYRMKREAKYASIRFSFHPGYTNEDKLVCVTHVLQKAGYSVGVWAVDNGDPSISDLKQLFKMLGIDFRIKEYLDAKNGTYRYPAAINGIQKKCMCKPSELLIAPDGRLFRCHYDLYHGFNSYGHILDEEVELPTDFLPCDNYGFCNPCDIKMKYNRFQQTGHCAVTIEEGG